MRFVSKAGIGAAALVGALAFVTSAHALTNFVVGLEAKCTAGKLKTAGKGVAAYTGCWSKAQSKALAVDPACLGKASTKTTGAFGKLDLKPPCYVSMDGGARDSDAAAYASSVASTVGASTLATGKCDSAKTKLVGKYVAGVAGCFAKAAAKLPGTVDNALGGCVDKNATKLQAGITKAELGVCSNTGQGPALLAAANAFLDAQGCAIAPGSASPCGTCGNGANDVGEACDASASPAGWASCGPDFTCVSCNCACPSTVTFSGNATAPESVLDTGWTGISHRAPIITNGDVTINLSCAASNRPCGTCNVTGPAANPNAGAGQLDSQRCSHDSSIPCTVDGDCGGGNTCEFYFGAPLPLAAGGVTTCVYNQFNGNVTGTANVESGEAATTAFLTARVYTGIAIDNPCPRCSDAGGINDGVTGGTCQGGTRNGLACDANGFVPNRPDFGRTSLDCPLDNSVLIATLPINLTNETNPVTKTITASSPNCGPASPGQKCMCQTCNNPASTPCFTNADCVAVGATICGGNRCVGGANNGAVCTNNTECPGGLCGRPGEPTKPSACLDNTLLTPDPDTFDCVDSNADGEGECTGGPITQSCSIASNHAQRGCTLDADCGGGVGSCESTNRLCFLTGGGTFQPDGPIGIDGTDTLIAVGMEDLPVGDVSEPTLGAVFCVGPTGSTSVNNVAGLPGPSRITIKGTAVGQP